VGADPNSLAPARGTTAGVNSGKQPSPKNIRIDCTPEHLDQIEAFLPKMHSQSGFEELFRQIEQKLSE